MGTSKRVFDGRGEIWSKTENGREREGGRAKEKDEGGREIEKGGKIHIA